MPKYVFTELKFNMILLGSTLTNFDRSGVGSQCEPNKIDNNP